MSHNSHYYRKRSSCPGKGQMSVVRAAMLAIRLAGKLLDLKASVFGL